MLPAGFWIGAAALGTPGACLMHACISFRLAVAFATLVLVERPAGASDVNQDATTAFSLPALLRQTTDIGGLRSKLEQEGVQLTFSYYADGFANPVGGVKQGFGYDGRFATIVDADLEKLTGWSGATFHASVHQIHGTQFSAANLGNLMLVSGVEAPTSTRLFNLWIEQQFTNRVSLRIGQFTAAQEFLVSDNADRFVNSTFGWPVLTSVDLPSGGPNYPEATPGARLQIAVNDQLTLRAAIFDGNPAGPGIGNPVGRDPYGLAFRVNDPPFVIVEMEYAYGRAGPGTAAIDPNQEGQSTYTRVRPASGSVLPGSMNLGAWINTGSFADQRFNTQGVLLAMAGGTPLQHQGNDAIYGVVDQMLWRVPGPGDRSLNFFMRGMAAPGDRNLIDLYTDGGFTFKGLIERRPADIAGLGFAVGRISPQAAAYDRDLATALGRPIPVGDFEAVVEWTYQWKLAEKWFFQPDLQYIFHPGGNIPNPLDPTGRSAIPNALVLGTRMVMRF
jgi:porin